MKKLLISGLLGIVGIGAGLAQFTPVENLKDHDQDGTGLLSQVECDGAYKEYLYYAGVNGPRVYDTFTATEGLHWIFNQDSAGPYASFVGEWDPNTMVDFGPHEWRSSGKPQGISSVVPISSPISEFSITNQIPQSYSRDQIAAQLVYGLRRYGYINTTNGFTENILYVENQIPFPDQQSQLVNHSYSAQESDFDLECVNIYVGYCGDGIIDMMNGNAVPSGTEITGQSPFDFHLQGFEECDPAHPDYDETTCDPETCDIIEPSCTDIALSYETIPACSPETLLMISGNGIGYEQFDFSVTTTTSGYAPQNYIYEALDAQSVGENTYIFSLLNPNQYVGNVDFSVRVQGEDPSCAENISVPFNPPALDAQVNVVDPYCAPNEVTITVDQDDAFYEVIVYQAGTDIEVVEGFINPGETSITFTGLAPGLYEATITNDDINECLDAVYFEIEEQQCCLDLEINSITQDNVLFCDESSDVTLEILGVYYDQAIPITVFWTQDPSSDISQWNSQEFFIDGVDIGETVSITIPDLGPGNRTFAIQRTGDDDDCLAYGTITVQADVEFTLSSEPALCDEINEGSIIVQDLDDEESYTITVNGQAYQVQGVQQYTISGLNSGIYTVTVQNNGYASCESSQSVTIDEQACVCGDESFDPNTDDDPDTNCNYGQDNLPQDDCIIPDGEDSCQYCTSSCEIGTNTLVSSCGDGVLDPSTEECDDGNLNNNDECANDCTLTFCGDGIIQTPNGLEQLIEECDDGNEIDDDACSNTCTENEFPICGSDYNGQFVYDDSIDGLGNALTEQTPGLCDVGSVVVGSLQYNTDDNQWSWLCVTDDGIQTPYPPGCVAYALYCGDEIETTNSTGDYPGADESCDDGDQNGVVPTVGYGEDSVTYCTSTCELATVYPSICGDGVYDDPSLVPGSVEQCDGVDQGICSTNQSCNNQCQCSNNPVDGECGIVVSVYDFDNSGDYFEDYAPPAGLCAAGTFDAQTLVYNPNTHTWTYQCVSPNGGTASSVCNVSEERCGDDILNGTERCDDGEIDYDGDGAVNIDPNNPPTVGYNQAITFCTNGCEMETIYGPVCGDGIVNDGSNGTIDYGEECEIGVDGYTYETCVSCQIVSAPVCGDLNFNPNTDDDPLTDCNPPEGVCDPGYDSDEVQTCTYCNESCVTTVVEGGICGDGELDAPYEWCDNGEYNDGVTEINGVICDSSCETVTQEPIQCESLTREYVVEFAGSQESEVIGIAYECLASGTDIYEVVLKDAFGNMATQFSSSGVFYNDFVNLEDDYWLECYIGPDRVLQNGCWVDIYGTDVTPVCEEITTTITDDGIPESISFSCEGINGDYLVQLIDTQTSVVIDSMTGPAGPSFSGTFDGIGEGTYQVQCYVGGQSSNACKQRHRVHQEPSPVVCEQLNIEGTTIYTSLPALVEYNCWGLPTPVDADAFEVVVLDENGLPVSVINENGDVVSVIEGQFGSFILQQEGNYSVACTYQGVGSEECTVPIAVDVPEIPSYCEEVTISDDRILVGDEITMKCVGEGELFELVVTNQQGEIVFEQTASESFEATYTPNESGEYTVTCLVDGTTSQVCTESYEQESVRNTSRYIRTTDRTALVPIAQESSISLRLTPYQQEIRKIQAESLIQANRHCEDACVETFVVEGTPPEFFCKINDVPESVASDIGETVIVTPVCETLGYENVEVDCGGGTFTGGNCEYTVEGVYEIQCLSAGEAIVGCSQTISIIYGDPPAPSTCELTYSPENKIIEGVNHTLQIQCATTGYDAPGVVCGDQVRSGSSADCTLSGTGSFSIGCTSEGELITGCQDIITLVTSPEPGQTFCGDGVRQAPNDQGVVEECDDGNDEHADGCFECKRERTTGGRGGGRRSSITSYCGDGVINVGEFCDEGSKNGDKNAICAQDCTVKPLPLPVPTQEEIQTQTLTGEPPKCAYIDPPSIQAGELLPFWWGTEEGVRGGGCSGVEDAGNIDSLSMYCGFEWIAPDDTSYAFTRSCTAQDLKSMNRYEDFVSTFDVSAVNGGTSVLDTSQFPFSYYGEYRIQLVSIDYEMCEVQETIITDSEGNQTIEYSVEFVPGTYEGRICQMNVPVTAPYFVNKGTSLTSTQDDKKVLDFFMDASGRRLTPLVSEDLTLRATNRDAMNQVLIRTQQAIPLATDLVSGDPLGLDVSVMKSSSSEIYVLRDNATLIGSKIRTLRPATLLVDGNHTLTIRGSMDTSLMIVAPEGTIRFEAESCDESETVSGIFIAKHLVGSSNLANASTQRYDRCEGGELAVQGILVGSDKRSLRQLVQSRRSTLENWFDSTESITQKVFDGASVRVDSSSIQWTMLPPLAADVLNTLQIRKQ